jgi:hypothetical protein
METAPRITYWACWWKATWVLFLIGCVLGYLNSREAGLATAIGAGLILAPIKGLFWGWIYWLIKK